MSDAFVELFLGFAPGWNAAGPFALTVPVQSG